MDLSKYIIERIEEARTVRGIPIAELARRIGVDKKRLWYVLKLQRSMRADEFVKICYILDLNFGYFITKDMADRLKEIRIRTIDDFGIG